MILGSSKPIDEVKPSFLIRSHNITLSILTKLPEVQNAAFSLLKAGGSNQPHLGLQLPFYATILRLLYQIAVNTHGWKQMASMYRAGQEQGILFHDTKVEDSARSGAKENSVMIIVDFFRLNLGLMNRLIKSRFGSVETNERFHLWPCLSDSCLV